MASRWGGGGRPGEVVAGISQFTFGDQGRSACTTIACEAALAILQLLHSGDEAAITPEFVAGIVQNGVSTYGARASTSVEHASADEVIPSTPRFASSLQGPGVPLQGLTTNPTGFTTVMAEAKSMFADASAR